jgi:hypothetical protein
MAAARPEAAFYRWKTLTEEQRRVASEINNWLLEYSGTEIPVRATEKSIFDWQRIDDKRASNVILVDGPRGAGKSSLLLTLIEVWRRSLAEEKLDEVFEAKPTSSGETDLFDISDPSIALEVRNKLAASMQDSRRTIENLRGGIIPIRVLDFAPLPQSTSIVTWVAAQLREFIDLLDERTSPAFSDVSTRSVVPWEPDWEKELPSRKAWADLIASAAWGWDDNIEARKGGLDPDAYAEELQQSERARVGIVERWHRLIAAIVKDASQRHPHRIQKNARIVVPIDDIDMNPRRTGELLDFVRTFWDAQLVFVLTGDSNLILAALTQRHANAPDTSGSGFSALELAAQSYDKAVPLAQRFRIGPLKPEERVKLMRGQLFPLGPTAPQEQIKEQTAFEQLLRRDRWAAEALPATLREVHDVRQKLAGREKVSDIAADIWADALEREIPKVEERDRIAQKVDLGREGMPSVEADIEARAVRLGEFRVPWADKTRTLRTHLVLEAVSGFVPFHIPESAPRLCGALILAADLAADDPDAAWSAISIAGRGFKFPAVRARVGVRIKSSNLAAKRAEDLLRKGLRWPVPNWPAPVDLAGFAEDWQSHISEILKSRQDAKRDEALARLFLERIQFIYHDRGETQGSQQPATLGDATTLKGMMGIILAEGKGPEATQRQQAFVEWARSRAPLLATPESGLQFSTATELLSAAFPESAKPQSTKRQRVDRASNPVHQARFDRVRVTLETAMQKLKPRDDVDAPRKEDDAIRKEVNEILIAIDDSFSDHPWVARFGKWSHERLADESDD